jgi:hypothetical protein
VGSGLRQAANHLRSGAVWAASEQAGVLKDPVNYHDVMVDYSPLQHRIG